MHFTKGKIYNIYKKKLTMIQIMRIKKRKRKKKKRILKIIKLFNKIWMKKYK